MASAALRLAARPGLEGLSRWLHMLGFRGHFVTKSRGYSTTLGELRQARADYRAEQVEGSEQDDDSTPVIGVWTYLAPGTSTRVTCSWRLASKPRYVPPGRRCLTRPG
jgi:hypothetical protein